MNRSVILCIGVIVICVCGIDHTFAQTVSGGDANNDKSTLEETSSTHFHKTYEKRMEKLEDNSNLALSSNVDVEHITKNYSVNSSVAGPVYKDEFSTSPMWLNSIKSGALQRTGLVILGIMSVLVVFFVVRAVRMRQKRSKSRKYGVITSAVSDMEMEPLERAMDDDEEETTLFDAQQKFRSK